MTEPIQSPVLGQDTIYICQSCNRREKEFAMRGRNYRYCTSCGGFAVKSILCDSYNYMTFNTPLLTDV